MNSAPAPVAQRLRALSVNVNFDDEDDEAIAAPVSIAPDGGWGWVVVACAFTNFAILDGINFTFISILDDLAKDFGKEPTTVASISSIILGVLYLAGPFVSAFLNRFGFRMTTMLGSVICATSILVSSFAQNFFIIIVFYGFLHGLGSGFINMCGNIVVGFYFEKKRPLATAIASSGCNLGIMIFSQIYSYITTKAGWRTTVMLQSSLIGILFFTGMTFRPLLSITVTIPQAMIDLSATSRVKSSPYIKMPEDGDQISNRTARRQSIFTAPSNMAFKPIADVIREEAEAAENGPDQGTSARPRLKSILKNVDPINVVPNYTPAQSVAVLVDKVPDTLTLTVNNIPDEEPRGCCAKCFTWKSHVKEARPMYRDDVFYDGDIKKLYAYQKSMVLTPNTDKTGLEYSLAVSRVTVAKDMKETRGICTTACRRTLATFIDPKLLKLPSFVVLLMGTFSIYLGFIIPYIFTVERSKHANVSASHYTLYVSVLGLAGLCGKISLGLLTGKLSPLRVQSFSGFVAGGASIISNYIPQYYFQYFYCFVYGFCSGGIVVTRSLILVDLYNLENLTNSTGLMLCITGFATFASTPVAGAIMKTHGVEISFIYCGLVYIIGAALISIVPFLRARELNSITKPLGKRRDTETTTRANTVANTK